MCMMLVKCPVCDRRVCDSNKLLRIDKLSDNNESSADVVIKCKNCKSCLAIKIISEKNI